MPVSSSIQLYLYPDFVLALGIPADYIEMFRLGNGGSGDVRGGDYAEFWSIDEIASNNQEYDVLQQAPGPILFGSSGGGEAFAFDTTHKVATIGNRSREQNLTDAASAYRVLQVLEREADRTSRGGASSTEEALS
jgi:hypothetical protein